MLSLKQVEFARLEYGWQISLTYLDEDDDEIFDFVTVRGKNFSDCKSFFAALPDVGDEQELREFFAKREM